MKKFLYRLLIFCAPYLILLIFLVIIISESREFYDIDEVIKNQINNEEEYLFGRAYIPENNYFKFQNCIRRDPEIIALGSSRVMQFREQFFSNVKFYNVGGVVNYIEDLNTFIKNYPLNSKLKIIILGLDQWWFNQEYNNFKDTTLIVNNSDYFKKVSLLNMLQKFPLKQFMVTVSDGKIPLKSFFVANSTDCYTAYGINGVAKRNGFRNDGSRHYGKIDLSDSSFWDYKFRDTFSRIKQGIARFEYGQAIDSRATKELEKFFFECKKRNIYVVSFLPPFATDVFDRMKNMNKEYRYLFSLYDTLAPVSKDFHFPIYNFSSFAQIDINMNNEEITDGFHGSEKAYLRLYIKMMQQDDVIKDCSNISLLQKELDITIGNGYVFESCLKDK